MKLLQSKDLCLRSAARNRRTPSIGHCLWPWLLSIKGCLCCFFKSLTPSGLGTCSRSYAPAHAPRGCPAPFRCQMEKRGVLVPGSVRAGSSDPTQNPRMGPSAPDDILNCSTRFQGAGRHWARHLQLATTKHTSRTPAVCDASSLRFSGSQASSPQAAQVQVYTEWTAHGFLASSS